MSRVARYKKAMYCAQLLEPRPLRLRDGVRELVISVTDDGQMFLQLPSFISLTQEHALLLRDWITENFEETEEGDD